jgi:hypothetical protein
MTATLPEEYPFCGSRLQGTMPLQSGENMTDAPTTYFTYVQRHLDDMNQPITLTADERDIVDDYATQEFGAKACAEQIAQERS